MIVSVPMTRPISSRTAPMPVPVALIIVVVLRHTNYFLCISKALSDVVELVRLVVHFVLAVFFDVFSGTNGAIYF